MNPIEIKIVPFVDIPGHEALFNCDIKSFTTGDAFMTLVTQKQLLEELDRHMDTEGIPALRERVATISHFIGLPG